MSFKGFKWHKTVAVGASTPFNTKYLSRGRHCLQCAINRIFTWHCTVNVISQLLVRTWQFVFESLLANCPFIGLIACRRVEMTDVEGIVDQLESEVDDYASGTLQEARKNQTAIQQPFHLQVWGFTLHIPVQKFWEKCLLILGRWLR